MSILDRFRKKKKEEPIQQPAPTPGLPQDLEKFRVDRQQPYQRPMEVFQQPGPAQSTPTTQAPQKPIPHDKEHQIELVIQKLDTIDARLRFIEEKLKRF